MIDTPRLVLRPFRPSDRERLIDLLTDLDVMRYSATGPKSADEVLDDLEDWTRLHHVEKPNRWVVTVKPDDALIGFCGFSRHTIGGEELWELGYRFLRAAWGHGFATEAAAACRDWHFARTSEKKFVLMIDPENVASARVAAKIGARHEFDAVCYETPVSIYVVRRPESSPANARR